MEPGEHTLMRRGAISGATARTRASTAAPTEDSETWPGLCRYISRPAVSEARLSLTPGGLVRYQLKTPYSNGTTHVLFEPLDLIARLATLVPKPRVNLIRYHGVFAPNSAHRAQVTKAHRGKGASDQAAARTDERTPPERRAAMTWAQRVEARVRHRHPDLPGLRRGAAHHRLHRGRGRDRENSRSPRRESGCGPGRPSPAIPGPARGALERQAHRRCAARLAALLRRAAGPRLRYRRPIALTIARRAAAAPSPAAIPRQSRPLFTIVCRPNGPERARPTRHEPSTSRRGRSTRRLSGLYSRVALAFLLRRLDPPPPVKRYSWEIEPEAPGVEFGPVAPAVEADPEAPAAGEPHDGDPSRPDSDQTRPGGPHILG